MSESYQKKIGRNRPPRVHITYDVETEGAVEKKELPFVVGVLGDFSGHPTEPLKSLKDRKVVGIDPDNFDDVLASMKPGLQIRVENTIADDGTEFPVELEFKSMEDFEPANVVQQVESLRRLVEIRNQLRDLATKADRSEDLEGLLERILQDEDALKQLSNDLGLDAKTAGDGNGAASNEPEPVSGDDDGGEA